MNMFEEAEAMAAALRLCSITQEELAAQMHVSQSYVANKLRLLKYSSELRQQILDAGLSERHARTVLRLCDERTRRMVIRRAKEEALSVAMTERLVDMLLATEEGGERDRVHRHALHYLNAALTDTVGILSSVGIRARRTTEEVGGEIRITLSVCK